MQRKLKSVFRRSSSPKASPASPKSKTRHTEPTSPPGDQRRVSSDRHGRTSVDSSATGSIYTGRSRPVSSVYDDRRQSQASAKHPTATDFASSSDPNGGAIANDYKAYLPALSPVNDDHGDEYISLDDDRGQITGASKGRHEEGVADRNIARYSTSMDNGNRVPAGAIRSEPVGIALSTPASNPTSGKQHSRNHSTDTGSAGKYIAKGGTTGNEGLVDGIRTYTTTSQHENGSQKRSSFSPKTARIETGRETRKSRPSDSDNSTPGLQKETNGVQGTQSGVRHATVDGTANGEETKLARQLRQDGVADLRNTTDTDGDIVWAPAVTHEVIKPHQHEIIQQKIYREIHNYEHFHRIQPVMMTEVLPPRHWIPSPNGEGLIEISADELPARTGKNRWWSICEHSSPYALQKTTQTYRTEPEIIEAGTFLTEEGFERKETIIIHPPTLADLTGYAGPVQAVHFDHKTGERWLGELTTMDKLRELQQSLDRAPDAQMFQMSELAESLPKVPASSMPVRKPVSGLSSQVHGSNVGRTLSAV
ncbi:uncharacterized protein EKO05_0001680 [Ascochyta rabiei]|uniref:Uncharacterized protein n=1 Tax=Didymella rabiei TaxID=5454 RepID=A0A163BD11_DIDRA|nr:uncharacterized protein EKO05_0001680 [Ascochyta rabiei]KZM21700.1 hypothetical protein ST47_g7079 [Ascochyta rabiei]UPX11056.1 hypothetical protein EKO05_0001680 [Ascochyta rabiei]